MKFKITLIFSLFIMCSLFPFFASAKKAKLDYTLSSRINNYPDALTLSRVLPDKLEYVYIRFFNPPSKRLLTKLEQQGVVFEANRYGRLSCGRIIRAFIPLELLDEIAANQQVLDICAADKSNYIKLMNKSDIETQASLVWSLADSLNLPVTGQGITIGLDDDPPNIFHPDFWQADGDTLQWIDVNSNNVFDAGFDAVDINKNGLAEADERLNVQTAWINDDWNLFDYQSAAFYANLDWLYNDANNNSIRDYGLESGFTEDSPAYGEPLFTVYDENKNNMLDAGEPLIALKTCKVKTVYTSTEWDYTNHEWIIRLYERGQNLIELNSFSAHATAAAGALAAGQQGHHFFTGIAPDVDIIVGPPEWAAEQGADIILYESGTYINQFLDGSSIQEELIDSLAANGIKQIVPAGNLNGLNKHFQADIPSLDSASIHINTPTIGQNVGNTFQLSVLWREENFNARLYLVTPENNRVLLQGAGMDYSVNMRAIWSELKVSPRNTTKLDIGVFRPESIAGLWKLVIINDGGKSVRTDGYIYDGSGNLSTGTHFADHVSSAVTVLLPATADSAITVGAYNIREVQGQNGALCTFSSLGPRIDGFPVIDICAPGNTIFTSAFSPDDSKRWGYQHVSGTSFSAPHAAGAVALFLQLNPNLSSRAIKQIFAKGALYDQYTGNTPNNNWGAGKLRILDSIKSFYHGKDDGNTKTVGNTISLLSNYPNPFNNTTRISFSLPEPGKVSVQVFNIRGQLVNTITNAHYSSGAHSLLWEGALLPSGIYFIRMQANGQSRFVKCTILK